MGRESRTHNVSLAPYKVIYDARIWRQKSTVEVVGYSVLVFVDFWSQQGSMRDVKEEGWVAFIKDQGWMEG